MKYIIDFELDIDEKKEGIDSQCDLEHVAVHLLKNIIIDAVNIDDLYDKTRFTITTA
jgi:hypothetical protein